MISPEETIERLGIVLPKAPSPVANYVSIAWVGDLLYLSGAGPAQRSDGSQWAGKIGKEFSAEEGYQAARSVGLVQISRLKDELGDLGRVKKIVKLLGMVNCTPEFMEHPAVINGCSDILVEIFSDAGKHARSAVGMGSLPFDIPVEIEIIVQVHK